MSILRVARMGHPVLRQVAEPIPPQAIGAEPLQRLVDDMLETVEAYDGAGLAAPQVHHSVRIVVLDLGDGEGMRVWINPELTPLTDQLAGMMEGCLSVPRVRGAVARPAAVAVRALDRHGQPVELQLEGFPAVVAQHECDHLDGVLFIDRADPRSLAFLDELRRYGPYPWEGDEGDDGEAELDDPSTDGEHTDEEYA